jgi:hypothetical protein
MRPGVFKRWFAREADRWVSQRRLMDRSLRLVDYVEACYERRAPPPGDWQELVVYTMLLHTDLRICWVQHTDILAYIYSQAYRLDTNNRMTPWLLLAFVGKYSHGSYDSGSGVMFSVVDQIQQTTKTIMVKCSLLWTSLNCWMDCCVSSNAVSLQAGLVAQLRPSGSLLLHFRSTKWLMKNLTHQRVGVSFPGEGPGRWEDDFSLLAYLQHLANLCKGAFVQWIVCVCVCVRVCGFFFVDVFALTRSCLIPAYCFLSHGWAYHVSVDRDTKEIGPCTIIESSHIPPAENAKVSSITSPVQSVTYSSKSILAGSCK